LPERMGSGDPRGAPFGVFRTADGWVALVAAADGQWSRLAPLLGGDALNERWRSHRERAVHREHIEALVAAWCAAQRTADVVAALEPREVPVGAVNPPWWARRDPHIAHRGTLERLRHPDRDEPTRWLGPTLPVRFSRASTSTSAAEPLGASTTAMLRDVLGLDDDEVAAFESDGAFGRRQG